MFFLLIANYDLQIRSLTNQLQELEEAQYIDKITDYNMPPEDKPDIVTSGINIIAQKIEPSPVKNSIQDVFGDDSNAHDTNSITDNIKHRYEELMVNYFLMDKCGKASNQDYQIIMSVLQKEIADAHVPARLKDDILTAAKGSYDELYSHSDCADPAIANLAAQYHNYISNLSKKISPN